MEMPGWRWMLLVLLSTTCEEEAHCPARRNSMLLTSQSESVCTCVPIILLLNKMRATVNCAIRPLMKAAQPTTKSQPEGNMNRRG